MISKTIGHNGVHNIFRHTQMVKTKTDGEQKIVNLGWVETKPV